MSTLSHQHSHPISRKQPKWSARAEDLRSNLRIEKHTAPHGYCVLFGSGSVPEYFALKKQHSVEIKVNKMTPKEQGGLQ